MGRVPIRRVLAPHAALLVASLGLAFTVLGLTTFSSPVHEIPVWWSSKLHLANLTEIAGKLQEPVDLPAHEPGLEVGNAERQKFRVFTCAQYLEAMGNGFFPATQYDAGIESLFVSRCYVLRDLQSVQPARRSYVRHDGWSTIAASEIPPLFPRLSDEGKALQILEYSQAMGKSWRSFQPNLRIARAHDDPLVLKGNDDLSTYVLEILASGDFNGDGWEDLAVSGSVHTKAGTYFQSRYFILSKRCKDSRMYLLTENTSPYRAKTEK